MQDYQQQLQETTAHVRVVVKYKTTAFEHLWRAEMRTRVLAGAGTCKEPLCQPVTCLCNWKCNRRRATCWTAALCPLTLLSCKGEQCPRSCACWLSEHQLSVQATVVKAETQIRQIVKLPLMSRLYVTHVLPLAVVSRHAWHNRMFEMLY